MGEKRDIQTGRKRLGARYSVRLQLMAAFLCLCLIVVSIPILKPGFFVQAADLQEHMVSSDDGEYREREDDTERDREDIPKERMLKAVAEERILFADGEEKLAKNLTEPGCGVVSEDVTWTTGGTLTNGELVVMPGVTLTINETITISGTVTIKGGGTIARGSANAGIQVGSRSELTIADIVMEGASKPSTKSMLQVESGKLTLGDGSVFRNFKKTSTEGGFLYLQQNAKAEFNDIVVENCSSLGFGGAVCIRDSTLTINSGVYKNNKSFVDGYGGGFIYNISSKLYIYGGRFIGNSSEGRGGCIYNSGGENSETYLYGGYFDGNTSAVVKYKGSGAVFCSSFLQGNTSFTISGNVKFCGDGIANSGTDGVYLDSQASTPRKINISDTLTYPVKLYLSPVEGYVIAQGVNNYQLLKRRDMKKINFVDVSDSGETWYAVLDEQNNQVYMSTINPGYGNFVYYVKNGAKGTAPTDDTQYALNADVTVQPADGLSYEGRVFRGWNTQEDGKGTTYWPGNSFKIQGDTDLYAIFKEGKSLYADFYSGSAGNKETVDAVMDQNAANGTITVPQPEPMAGYEALGWSRSPDGFEAEAEIVPDEEITLTENAVYYGVYQKAVTLSYDANGGDTCPAGETGTLRANVNEKEVSYDIPTFTAAGPLPRTGYVFAGWNTADNGKGEPYLAGESVKADKDTTLYAMWIAGNYTPYRIEHFRQDLEGDGYSRVEMDTEYMAGKTGDSVEAEANPYTGFAVSKDTELGKAAGVVAADGSLVLQMYYDRDIYEIDFDLNGGEGIQPQSQAVRYGGLLQETEEPQRTGYTFAGWYKDKEGTEAAYWNPYQTVEGNTDSLKTTLYAKWVDLAAPVLGEASFGNGYRNLADWIVSQKKLTITVPITEKGSGLKRGDYRLESADGKIKTGSAVIRAQQTVMPKFQVRSSGFNAVMTVRGDSGSGEGVAEITIEEDFKGSIYLTCTDNAGNTSVEKILTADGAGVVVEDNAPDILFSKAADNVKKGRTAIDVEVVDTAGKNISAGIAAISYQIDNGKVKAEDKENFADNMVETYRFTVDFKGEGEHTLAVTAEDNAGNKSKREITVEIKRKKAVVVPKTKTPVQQTPGPASGEPATGENIPVKMFATLGMIAGFTYLLLYFSSGENGITEREKEEIISRLIRWAQRGRFRRYPALVLIWLFLIYYHSIGRSVSVEWQSVCNG